MEVAGRVSDKSVHFFSALVKTYCFFQKIDVASKLMCDVAASSVARITDWIADGETPLDICENLHLCSDSDEGSVSSSMNNGSALVVA